MYDFPDYVENNYDFLKSLAKSRSEHRRQNIIKQADREKLLAIVEICTNILKGRIPLNNNQRKRLSKSADFYRSIARARSEKTVRHRIQSGGSIGALAAVLSPIIGVIAQRILDKSIGNA